MVPGHAESSSPLHLKSLQVCSRVRLAWCVTRLYAIISGLKCMQDLLARPEHQQLRKNIYKWFVRT